MPLHGKIVVIKRSGGDGTEFPLTASCLFGRKAECDIRIQLPSVSKEHCRIELNENKEVILTNLSVANPTHINGKVLHQSERLKHGDVITILDRSFRFEYPPAPTPKKRTSAGATSDTLKVLRDQQVGEFVVADTGEKKPSEPDPHLKDGTNIDNIQRSLEKTLEVESKEDEGQSKTNSPFGDLYEMIKKSLHVKTPRVSSVSLVQTPSSRLCTPKSASVMKKHDKSITFTPKKDEMKVPAVPRSVRKQEKTIPVPSADVAEPRVEEGQCASKYEATPKPRKSGTTPQKFTVSEVLEQISAQSSKSPPKRRSKEGTPVKSAASMEQGQAVGSPKTENPRRTSPRTLGTAEKVVKVLKKRKSEELGSDLPASKMKKKRVSFGGHLSPELFDKRLPPDSPLRRGATPRRSLSLCRPKLSLLRRASVGFLKEKSPAKRKTPSPKKLSGASPKTPTGKKSPKSGSPSPRPASASKKSPQSKSPKATSPEKRTPKSASSAQKSPKSISSTPKAASPVQRSPRSRSISPKAATPAGNSPTSKRLSPAQKMSTEKLETHKANDQLKIQPKSTTPGREACNATPTGKRSSPRESNQKASLVGATPTQNIQTPVTQGRFSVSHISTPSPAAEVDAVVRQEPVISVTPKIQLKRTSMKSTSRKTPSVSRSAKKILQRKSGISRASLKAVQTSWANIVKFGQTKTPAVALANKTVTQKTLKTVSKPQKKFQTPAKKLDGHVSTGHADSPVTIVVGRAHKRMVSHPTGAAPRVVANTALSKKDMKMDEDLTGISEMFKTPANERKRRSLMNESSASKTPVGTSGTEPSVLNTPEEPGEMVVSPLSVASTVKSRRYNSEAVQRLLNGDQDSSFVCDVPTIQVQSNAVKLQDGDFKATLVTTPRQKPELPESLTGVKRIMKTPRQKAEPVEDLRGKLMKTPKQKPKQLECLTGVKRIMKTPKQTAEPIEDLRGKILKTPRQKAEQQECLTGVKRIMKTPKQKAEPLEDIRGKLLITPKQKPEQQECLTGVKRIFKTPKQKAKPVEDLRGKLLKTPKARRSGEVSLDGVKELLETPAQRFDHQSEITVVETPKIKSSMTMCITDIKGKSSPTEDTVGQKKIVRTPKQKGEPVEENFGIKRLMKSPRLRGVAPVEDFEGLQELMQEPLTYWAETETSEVKMETEPQEAADASQQQPEEETETDPTATNQAIQKKAVRGRRAKTVESKHPEDRKEASKPPEDPVIVAPVRGRRGKKIVAAAPPSVKHTARSRNTGTAENSDLTVTEGATQPTEGTFKTKRGRNTRNAPKDPSEEEVTPDCDVAQKVNECAAPADKPKRGRKPDQSATQQQDEACVQTEDVPPSAGVKEASSEQPDVMETVVQAPENPPEAEAAACEITEISSAQKKSVRGKRTKQTGSKEAEGCSGEPVSAPVRGRRAKKTEPAGSSAVRQTTRTRNTTCRERASDQPAVETQAINEVSAEAVNPTLGGKDSTLLPEELTSKPVRGRKAKAAPAEPEEAQAQPPLSVSSAVEKPKRGRTKSDAKDKHVTEEIKKQPEPPVRVKTGRKGQQKEEGWDVDVKTTSQETSICLEPVKKSRRTIKAEQDHEKADVQTAEVVPEKTETPSAESVSVSQQAAVATKPRRGGRKAKPGTETAAPVQSSEVTDVPDASKPKGSRRGKQVTQDVVTTDEPKEQNKPASSPQVIKAGRKGRKTQMSPVVPAKKARRGTTAPVQEAPEESAVHVSEPAPAPIKPARRGRRAAAKNEITSDAATEDLTEAAAEDSKKSKKSVQFTPDVQVLEIPKATPAKARRGGKSKLGNVIGESGSKDADKPEEESLSEETVKPQPVRRGRRGGKAADIIVESTSKEGGEEAETEPQPKTRRGRSAKK